MPFLFASSHLPETGVQRPEDEEEDENMRPEPHSGGVRAFSHLPERASSSEKASKSSVADAAQRLAQKLKNKWAKKQPQDSKVTLDDQGRMHITPAPTPNNPEDPDGKLAKLKRSLFLKISPGEIKPNTEFRLKTPAALLGGTKG